MKQNLNISPGKKNKKIIIFFLLYFKNKNLFLKKKFKKDSECILNKSFLKALKVMHQEL